MNQGKARCDRCHRWAKREELSSDERLPKHTYTKFCASCLEIIITEQTVTCDCGLRHIIASQWVSDSHRYMFRHRYSTKCPRCKMKDQVSEAHTLELAIRKAKHSKLPATLTLHEWLATLSDFQGMCAYCRIRPYQVIEHFIPESLGGGLTRSNCVPGCFMCNARKRNLHPDKHNIDIPEEAMKHVRAYLQQFS